MDRVFKSKVFGAKSITPTVILKDGGKVLPQYSFEINEAKQTAMLKATYDNLFIDALYFAYNEKEVWCRRVFENISGATLDLVELGFEINGISFGADPAEDYSYSTENCRTYGIYTLPIDYDRSSPEADNSALDIEADRSGADPGTICERIGSTPYQPIPVVLFSNYNVKNGIVHGTLSQKVFFHNYIARHEDDLLNINILSSFKGIDALEMQKDRVLTDAWYLTTTDAADDIEKVFADYIKALREKLPCNYGGTDINRKSMVWGSWNDGILRDVTEDILLREAKFISENFPTVRWMQLDDGYSASSPDIAHGLGVPYEGEDAIDKEKFPHGLRYVNDKIRSMGLRPAVWIGGFVPKATPLFKAHPDWFADYSFRTKKVMPLDVSQPQVRAYMVSALQTFFGQYGYESVKHDFWSYVFEDSHNLMQYKDRSGYEYRHWWLSQIRAFLPEDAYMQTGCDICQGNPFLGAYFTNYRYGVDVGSGHWENIKKVFKYGAGCFAAHMGDLFVPNSDSVGILDGLSDPERMFLMNYCIATHSMVELSGKLSQYEDKAKLKRLKKVICNPNNGQDVYFVNFDYRSKKVTYPETMYFNTGHFTTEENNPLVPLKTVAFFNIGEEEKTYTITAQDLKLPAGDYVLTDVWTGEAFALEGFSATLPGHHSRMLAVTDKTQALLTDANIRINCAKKCADKLVLATDYAQKEAELTLTRAPKRITFDGADISFAVAEEKTCFALPGKGTLEIEF